MCARGAATRLRPLTRCRNTGRQGIVSQDALLLQPRFPVSESRFGYAFETWMELVDGSLRFQFGKTSEELPKVDFETLWRTGFTPTEAATQVAELALAEEAAMTARAEAPSVPAAVAPSKPAGNTVPVTRENTRIDTWFERDRAYVLLYDQNDNTLLEWWDDAVGQAIEDGFLDPKDYHGSAVEYANSLGITVEAPKRVPRRTR
jgi:hypothetical protein